ncbi:hypothetical protein [Flavobacterium sp. UBA7680]|uniref:hypothetical protein n=1 Tax=Flavobacterium sp. UBA7680 TaxID=1946559 RepID=UPI0025C2070F|nr:hypothetical protein [Flavobacterium sp. UBA7680]
MKKTALTFGLFSLVVVATSFANPTIPSIVSNEKSNIILPIDGGQKTGLDRKQDIIQSIDGGQKTGLDRKQDFAKAGGFGSDSQFTISNRKND